MSNRNKTDKKKGSPLTLKQRRVLALVNGGMTPTKAVMQTYDTEKPTNAGAIWANLKKKPKIQAALVAYSSLAEETIVGAIMDFKESDKQWERTLAVENAKWLHDKVHGKAVQQTSNVNVNFTAHAQKRKELYDL